MNVDLEGDYVVDVALTGRVPCNVIGRVEKGDILVTSAVPGYAIVDNDPRIGTVIGKAVSAKDTEDKGTVEVVVGRVKLTKTLLKYMRILNNYKMVLLNYKVQ